LFGCILWHAGAGVFTRAIIGTPCHIPHGTFNRSPIVVIISTCITTNAFTTSTISNCILIGAIGAGIIITFPLIGIADIILGHAGAGVFTITPIGTLGDLIRGAGFTGIITTRPLFRCILGHAGAGVFIPTFPGTLGHFTCGAGFTGQITTSPLCIIRILGNAGAGVFIRAPIGTLGLPRRTTNVYAIMIFYMPIASRTGGFIIITAGFTGTAG
jgi:hypothetical protein